MSVPGDRKPSSSRPRRARRQTPAAGERGEHLGRHAEHIGASLGRVAQLLGPGVSPGGAAAADPLAGAELEDEESEDE